MRFLWICLLFIGLCSCQKTSPEQFQDESRRKIQELIEALQKIECLDEMNKASPQLKSIYDDLAELVIRARRYQIKTKTTWGLTQEDHLLSDELKAELHRLYRMEGVQELMEKCQRSALFRVDAFEKLRQCPS